MEGITTEFEAMVDGGVNLAPRDRTWNWGVMWELYPADYEIPADGFLTSYADATICFSNISEEDYVKDVGGGLFIPAYRWNGIDYIRQVASFNEIKKTKDESPNNVTLTLNNTLRYAASLYLSDVIKEGMWIVCRLVSRSITDSSRILYTGRTEKAVEINESTFSIPCLEPLSSADITVPKRPFTEDDPEGRHPGDILYQGFHFNVQVGTFPVDHVETVTTSSFFGLLHHTRTRRWREYRQYSSQDSTPYGEVLREVFGQVQVELIPMIYADNGPGIIGLFAAANGRIAQFVTTRCVTKGWSQPSNQTEHHGFTADVVGGDNDEQDPLFPTAGYFSKTAYKGLGVEGSSPDVEDEPPTIVCVLLGRVMPVYDASNELTITDWTDNNSLITRNFLTDPDFLNLPGNLIDDSWTLKTYQACNRPIVDSSNSERVFIPNDALAGVGTNFNRFHGTSRISTAYYRKLLGLEGDGFLIDDFIGFEITTPPAYIAPVILLRRSYTCNVVIAEKVKATDFLWHTLLPSFRGFITQGATGKYQIRTEEPADSTYLRSDILAGVTELPVFDVTQWQASTEGRILIGSGPTSEHIKVLSTKYGTVGNSITLTSAATGGLTAVSDNATLEGGDDDTQASSFVTIGGTPADSLQASITIDGIVSAHTLTDADTLETIAGMLKEQINANTRLNKYIVAEWSIDTPTIVTIRAKLGSLVLEEATEFAHVGPHDLPDAPTVSASTGTLPAGDYYVARTWVNSNGETTISEASLITLDGTEQIDVDVETLPAGITATNLYISTVPDSLVIAYAANNDGSPISINELPLTTANFTPESNTTGEETIRIAHAFDASNIIQKSFRWPLGSRQNSYNQFVIEFRDAAQDFRPAKYTLNSRAHQALVGKINTLTLDGSAVDNWDQAVRLTKSTAAKALDGAPDIGKVTFSFTLASRGRALLLEEGQVVALTDDTGGKVDGIERLRNFPARIEEVKINERLEVTLTMRAYTRGMFVDQSHARNIILPASLSIRPPSDGRLVLDVDVIDLVSNTYTLSNDEASNDIIEITGELEANLIIYVPADRQFVFIDNTTGAFTVTIKKVGEA